MSSAFAQEIVLLLPLITSFVCPSVSVPFALNPSQYFMLLGVSGTTDAPSPIKPTAQRALSTLRNAINQDVIFSNGFFLPENNAIPSRMQERRKKMELTPERRGNTNARRIINMRRVLIPGGIRGRERLLSHSSPQFCMLDEGPSIFRKRKLGGSPKWVK